ncbi:MAG: hypothetical protein EOM05_05630 [Clostridia bacterium]|nr:hypothetical protein [Clostridia bacterium]
MAIDTGETLLCSQKIEIFVNEEKVALAQECSIKTIRNTKLISSYGEGEASAVAVGAKQYFLTLTKIERENASLDFATLCDFSVEIKKQGKIHTFSNCEWTELCEHILNGKSTIQTAVITSPKLNVTEA